MSRIFKHKIKVYYEDTDLGGVVYHANYLKFLERARTEMIHSFDLTNKKLLQEHKILIVVKSCDIKFIKPANIEDELQIYSLIELFTKASFTMNQKIKRNDELISEAKIHLVTVNSKGVPTKIPTILLKNFK